MLKEDIFRNAPNSTAVDRYDTKTSHVFAAVVRYLQAKRRGYRFVPSTYSHTGWCHASCSFWYSDSSSLRIALCSNFPLEIILAVLEVIKRSLPSMSPTVKQSNPTEINGGWTPAGDDAAGFIFTQQTCDWNGRPLETRHTLVK